MKWLDINLIAQTLYDTYPDIDPRHIRFTDLHNWIINLPEFVDDPQRGGEKILEAIQMAWLDEYD